MYVFMRGRIEKLTACVPIGREKIGNVGRSSEARGCKGFGFIFEGLGFGEETERTGRRERWTEHERHRFDFSLLFTRPRVKLRWNEISSRWRWCCHLLAVFRSRPLLCIVEDNPTLNFLRTYFINTRGTTRSDVFVNEKWKKKFKIRPNSKSDPRGGWTVGRPTVLLDPKLGQNSVRRKIMASHKKKEVPRQRNWDRGIDG